jgi:hypothetical protein
VSSGKSKAQTSSRGGKSHHDDLSAHRMFETDSSVDFYQGIGNGSGALAQQLISCFYNLIFFKS